MEDDQSVAGPPNAAIHDGEGARDRRQRLHALAALDLVGLEHCRVQHREVGGESRALVKVVVARLADVVWHGIAANGTKEALAVGEHGAVGLEGEARPVVLEIET